MPHYPGYNQATTSNGSVSLKKNPLTFFPHCNFGKRLTCSVLRIHCFHFARVVCNFIFYLTNEYHSSAMPIPKIKMHKNAKSTA